MEVDARNRIVNSEPGNPIEGRPHALEDSHMKDDSTSRVDDVQGNPDAGGSTETELEEKLFLAAIQTAEPVTVRLYGIKEVTLPAYVLLLGTTLIVVFGLIAAATEIVVPRTAFGEWAQGMAELDPWILEAAIWAPPLLLLGLAFEVLECAVVMSAFRRNFQARDERIRQRLCSNSRP